MPPLFASMRLGLGLGLGNFRATSTITESVWTIAAAADGTKYVRIRCATTGQTLTAAGGAEIKLGSGGEWGTSVDIPAGTTSSDIYYRGNGTGGTLTFPNPENITYLYLYNTGTSIDGVPPAIGKTLSTFRILGGASYDYPWTSQTWDATTKRTWTASTMAIDCVADAPTPAQFNTWLLGLASVSNPGTATLILKNTPTIDELNDAGCGETDTDSGYYAMVTTLGYTLTLGSQ